MKVAVVVPTADGSSPRTSRCLSALRDTTEGMDVVVQVVESNGPGFRFSRSVNRGIMAHPDCDAWILLNDDATMRLGWLQAMLAEVKPGVGVVGAVLDYPSGGVQHAGGFLMGPRAYLLRCLRELAPFHAVRKIRRTPPGTTPFAAHHRRIGAGHVEFVTGACFLITREARDRVGLLDEDYEFSFEDIDYCLRAREAGLRVVLATNAHGVHEERATGHALTEKVARSEATFSAKWTATRMGAVRGA